MYKLDHIVHFVERPEKLVDQMNAIGVYTVPGGRHEMWGTYNSLSYFEDLSYVEFIGIFDDDLFNKSAKEPFTLHETYEKRNRKNGFNRIALRTNTIEEDATRLKEAGLTVFGPKTFSRKRPDGSVVSWKLLHFGFEGQEVDFPFLIQWDGEDSIRTDELVKLGTIKQHPLGKLEIKEILFTVPNLEIAKQWAELFHFHVESNSSFAKVSMTNCDLIFNLNTNVPNNIIEVVISGATEEKSVELENARYQFTI